MTPRKQIAAILARLSLHYHRPDYSQAQAKLLFEDYLNDLEPYSPRDVEIACEEYRRKPESKYFPKVGELLEIMRGPKWLREPKSSLPTWRTPAGFLEAPRGKTKSVAEVLREHGHEAAAAKWART